jgi:chromosomal replication initiator protein
MKVRDAGARRSLVRDKGKTARATLRARLGEEIYACWFAAMEFDSFDGRVVRASVPVKILKNWIQAHYAEDLLQCCAAAFTGAERVEVVLRQPGMRKL